MAITAMTSDRNVWQCYFKDFITHKLELVDPSDAPQQGDVVSHILNIYFGELHSKKMPLKLVELHCHASIEHLSLAQMATSLRPLNKLERVRMNDKHRHCKTSLAPCLYSCSLELLLSHC